MYILWLNIINRVARTMKIKKRYFEEKVMPSNSTEAANADHDIVKVSFYFR